MDFSSWFPVGGAFVGAASYGGETVEGTISTLGHLRRVLQIEGQQQRQEEHDRLFRSMASGRDLQKNKDEDRDNTDVTKEAVVVEEKAVTEDPVVEDTNTDDDRKDLTPEQTESATLVEPTSEPMGDASAVLSSTTNNQEVETRIDLVKLVPFDVKLMLVPTSPEINSFALTDIVTEWMDESLEAEVKRMELGLSHSTFDSVILEERAIQHRTTASTSSSTSTSSSSSISGSSTSSTAQDGRATGNMDANNDGQRHLQEPQVTSLTIASYEGVTLWKHTTPSNLQVMTPDLLEDLERQALLQDGRLLELLQASPAQGLGESVMDVRAYINPNPADVNLSATATNDIVNNTIGVTNANLELIIVVAIVVACMAFAFLVFSLFWAWRFDQQRRDSAYRVDTAASPMVSAKKSPDSNTVGRTDTSEFGEESTSKGLRIDNVPNVDHDTTLYPPSEGGNMGGNYPESVISEDISTSLSAYYRSGMGTRPFNYGMRPGALGKDFEDQASFSSIESYGYSLDGYAPSLGGNTWANPSKNTDKAEEVDGDEEDNDRQGK